MKKPTRKSGPRAATLALVVNQERPLAIEVPFDPYAALVGLIWLPLAVLAAFAVAYN